MIDNRALTKAALCGMKMAIATSMRASTGGDRDSALSFATKLLTQDSPGKSKRLWASAFGVLTVFLAAPELQNLLIAVLPHFIDARYVPMATGLVTIILPLLSKLADPRPTQLPVHASSGTQSTSAI